MPDKKEQEFIISAPLLTIDNPRVNGEPIDPQIYCQLEPRSPLLWGISGGIIGALAQ